MLEWTAMINNHSSSAEATSKEEETELTDYGGEQTDRSSSPMAKDMDDILDRIGCGPFQVLSYCLAAISFFAFVSRNILTFSFINLKLSEIWDLNPVQSSVMPASSALGLVFGGLIIGFVSDRYGRVWPYAIFALLLGGFLLASAFSPNFYVFVALRYMVAVFIGGLQVLVHPTLLEFLPVDRRGQVGVLVLLNQSIGSSLAALLAWLLIPHLEHGWRYFIIITSLPSFMMAIYRVLFYFESPRYLITRGKTLAAWKVLSKMAAVNGKNLDNISTIEDFKLQQNLVEVSKRHVISNILYILKPPLIWHTIPLLAVISITRILVFSGSVLFLSVLLENLGVHPYMGLLISSVSQIPGILLMSIITEWEWFGRLNTLRLFTILAVVAYFLFAFIQTEVTIPVFTVLIFFSIAPMISMGYMYMAESYPTQVRATAVGFINFTMSFAAIPAMFLLGYIASLSNKFSWIFPVFNGCLCLLTLFVSCFLKQEPQGKKLTDKVDS